jgi:serine protease Do
VIGVNTAIVTPSGANAGVGFAIPADVANRITSQLIRGVKIERGYIGVTISPVTQENAEALNVPDTTGAYITETTKSGPADKAGVQAGDIVKTVNGQPVKSPTELTRRIADVKVGEKITLGVVRNGKLVNLTLTAALRPSEEDLAKGLNGGETAPETPGAESTSTPSVMGLSVKTLTPESRRTYGLDADVKGVVITNVDINSDGGQKGLKPGDVIVLADQRPITTQADFAKVVDDLKKAGRPAILLLVSRDGRNIPLPLSLKDAPK